ncbi:MAG: NAD(P)H-binding protein [Kofleriaceae bacterium]|nr:NAD(P)H-binding protein [Kofleriaceae bacterium]
MAEQPILVTGATGTIGGVGRAVVQRLLARDLPVRAAVHRDDDRAAALRAIGAEVVVADLTRAPDIMRALAGCRRMYFGLGVASYYLEATATTAAVARAQGDLEVLVNMSQMTVSQMSLTSRTESEQQRLHWLSEQVLDWSGLPVVHVRPTIFQQSIALFAAESIARDGTIRVPFGQGRTSPVNTDDVADVIVAVLTNPRGHIGHVYELTGPRSQTMDELAAEFAAALGRPIRYVDAPYEQWYDEMRRRGLPDHVFEHLATMTRLHAANRYDRLTGDIEQITGHPATPVREYVAQHAGLFGGGRAPADQPAMY